MRPLISADWLKWQTERSVLWQEVCLFPTDSQHDYLFEGTFYLHPLCPWHSWICKAVPTVATTTHIYSLLVQKAEGLSHHMDCIVSEGWCVLKIKTHLNPNIQNTTDSKVHTVYMETASRAGPAEQRSFSQNTLKPDTGRQFPVWLVKLHFCQVTPCLALDSSPFVHSNCTKRVWNLCTHHCLAPAHSHSAHDQHVLFYDLFQGQHYCILWC